MLYYDKINNKFDITNTEENFITCIIGNKSDKKITFDREQENKYNKFIKNNNNLYIYEISTKPFFNFNKFFYDFFFDTLNPYHEKLFNEYNFKKNFEKVITLCNGEFQPHQASCIFLRRYSILPAFPCHR